MKIFIDSADITQIKQVYEWGIAEGVTTNPGLLKKAVDVRKKKGKHLDLKAYITAILTTAKGTPVSLEVTEITAEGMIRQGKELYKLFNSIGKKVMIKIPINTAFQQGETQHFEGIKAIRVLRKEGIPINCTLIFTPEQALLAAKAGATVVSPFAGRVDDFLRSKSNVRFEKSDYFPQEGMYLKGNRVEDDGIHSGIHLVEQCVRILKQYGLATEVLAASIRNPRQAREAALVGADIATLPFSVIQEMVQHHQTVEGIRQFTKDIVPDYVDMAKSSRKLLGSRHLGISIETGRREG